MIYLSADVGGTFTDLVLIDGDSGETHLDKVPSTPGSADAVIQGIDRITRAANMAPTDVDIFVHGFTVGTNAFLTRSGARIVMAVSAGMRDVLEIGDQMRPHLYHLQQSKPTPVVPRSQIVEVDERLDAFGAVVTTLSQTEAERVTKDVAVLNPEAVAVCLGFSFLDADHEQMLGGVLEAALPGIPIYLSSNVNPQIEEFPRANTTAIAAYVGPVIDRYISTLDQGLAQAGLKAPLRLMRSDGGVATPDAARTNPAALLLSGPAGGVIAGADVSGALDVANLVTFDMGGTSADFSLIVGGEPRSVAGRVIDGQPLRLPTLDIETISAGGGSIARVDLGGALKVGPDSAGAHPGPACYGQGGTQATITDAAVVLGILDPAEYLGGEMALDAALARKAIEDNVATPLNLTVEQAALGVVRVATAGMNQAIRTLSVERGFDLRGFALLAFGGAGPIYASFMARDLGMAEVLVPRNPGVYAAQGLLMSDIRHTAQAAFQRRLTKVDEADLGARIAVLKDGLDDALDRDGINQGDRYFRVSADMRCVGQFHELQVPLVTPGGAGWWDPDSVATDFHGHHLTSYGHADESIGVEFVNLRVEAFGRTAKAASQSITEQASGAPPSNGQRPVYLDDENGFRDCPVYFRDAILPGHVITGPAVIPQRDSTTVVLDGQIATVTPEAVIRIETAGGS
jgi:N-methylhydantoinase A